jgi:hypothetical protein
MSVVFLLLSCGGKETEFSSEKDFHTYLNDQSNGFIQSMDGKDLKFETKLIPPFKDDKDKIVTVQLRISRLDGLSVLDLDGNDQQQRLQDEGYLSFEIMKDVYLLNGKEIVPATFSHYERNYGLKPSIDISFDFPAFNLKGDPVFVYNDLLFGQGMIKINYSKNLFSSCDVKQ